MSFDLTNEGLDFTPQQVSLQALLSGQAPQKNQKFFKHKGEAMAEANSLLNSTPMSSFSVSPTAIDSVTPGAEPEAAAPASPQAATSPADLVNAVTGKPSTAMPVTPNAPNAAPAPTIAPPNVSFSGGAPTLDQSAQSSALPKFIHPTAAEVDKDQIGSPRLTKLGTFLSLLKSAATGAAAGEASIQQTPRGAVSNPGAGFLAAQSIPLEQQKEQQGVQAGTLGLQREQTQNNLLPYTLAMQQRLAQLEANKTIADTGRSNADAEAARQKGNLDLQESITKPYIKGEDGSIYQATPDGKGGTSLQRVQNTGTLVSLPDDVLQQVGLGDHVGKNWQIPVHTASEIQKMADEGNQVIGANGRMLEVNKRSGKVVRDFGAANPIVGINLQNGPLLSSTPNIPAGVTGEESLKSMPASIRAQVQDVGDYKVPLNVAIQRVPEAARANFETYLRAYNPNYSVGDYEARNKTAIQYTPGGEVGKQALAFNTAIRHLGGVADEASKLNNTDFQDWNRVKNFFKAKFGNADVTNFNTYKTYLGGELAKGLGGGLATDSSRAEASEILSNVQSPAQIAGALKTAVGLMGGKISAQESAYELQMGGHHKSLIDPGAQAVLNRLGIANEATGGATGQTKAAPVNSNPYKNPYSH